MNQDYITYNKALKKVKEHFKTLNSNGDGTFAHKNMQIKLLISLPVDYVVDGSKNGLNLNGIGKFNFILDDLTDIYIFSFESQASGKIETVIIPRKDLLNRLSAQNFAEPNQENVRFWLTDQGLYETYGIGAEYEFMGLWLSEKRNYNAYLK
jgi:hypothetical protein